ncbi:Penicillin-binding protein 1C [alpha proteobacterium BAL199]|jgi:penicillin-binding protein 1C|nr:Penicillin-binding protein 1C [alpha proteobacterium BAL199]
MTRRQAGLLATVVFTVIAVMAPAAWGWLVRPLERATDPSLTVTDRDGRPLRVFLSADDTWRLPADPDRIDPGYQAMLIAIEDQRFADHLGVDPLAIVRAVGQMIGAGRVVSGASTLTMQTVRLLDPQPRTLGAKATEAARALILERRLDKREILALYLTLAPFGGNLEGVRAASLAYFGKEPIALTPAEAALLVAIPQAPERLRPDRHPQAARIARNRILIRAADSGTIPANVAAEAMTDPVPTIRRPMPMHAPHLTRRIALAAAPGTASISTTLDGGLQRRIEGMAAHWAETLEPEAGIAVVVADTTDGAVLAHLGSPDFFATRRAGQIDMTRAVRSPGSTLKPFLYGLAFDDGFLDPRSIVTDAPQRISGYAPANFAPVHIGELPAAEALRQSLNVPTVAILDRYGPGRFVNRLRAADTRLELPHATDHPGLAVILGGVGTTLEDLVSLYTGLSGDGRVRPLVVHADRANGTDSRPLLSAGASWEVARILEESLHPAHAARRRGGPIAWKTGTSYGFRDAWAIGIAGNRVVGVWVGRPDGTPRPGHYGARSAAPLLFEIFDTLPGSTGLTAPLPTGSAMPPSLRPLPQALTYFPPRDRSPGSTPVTIAYPLDGSEIERPGERPIALRAKGGKRPLVWLIDGRPIPASPHRRDAAWQPDGLGFATLTVIDAEGLSAQARVRVRGTP